MNTRTKRLDSVSKLDRSHTTIQRSIFVFRQDQHGSFAKVAISWARETMYISNAACFGKFNSENSVLSNRPSS